MAVKKKPVGKRPRIEIATQDQEQIVRALEKWAATEDFVGLRLRAFVYLLWDGAVRTKVAVALDIEDLVADSDVLRIQDRIVQAPCEANRYRELRFFLTKRTRAAVADYLKVARRDGWLVTSKLQGPLFISAQPRGGGKRVARRTMIHAWRDFLEAHTRVKVPYSVDDIVYTGRLAFLRAADGDTSKLSAHTGLTEEWAGKGFAKASSPDDTKDVLSRLDKLHEK